MSPPLRAGLHEPSGGLLHVLHEPQQVLQLGVGRAQHAHAAQVADVALVVAAASRST